MERLEGVQKAQVSFPKGEAYVTYDPKRVTVEQMLEAIRRAGFQARLARDQKPPSSENAPKRKP